MCPSCQLSSFLSGLTYMSSGGKDALFKQKQKSNYDRSHHTQLQHPLDTSTAVWM